MRTEQEVKEKYDGMHSDLVYALMDEDEWEIVVNVLGWVLDIPKDKRGIKKK